jgi:hypothetical protein
MVVVGFFAVMLTATEEEEVREVIGGAVVFVKVDSGRCPFVEVWPSFCNNESYKCGFVSTFANDPFSEQALTFLFSSCNHDNIQAHRAKTSCYKTNNNGIETPKKSTDEVSNQPILNARTGMQKLILFIKLFSFVPSKNEQTYRRENHN